MIKALKPYPEYKLSGLPWAEEIPAHWSVERAKRLFTKMNRPALPNEEVVTCFRDGLVTLRKNRRVRGFTESLLEIGYQGIRQGDLIIHAMDAFAGAAGVSDSDGKGSPVYAVCQPRTGVNPHYYAFIVREMARSQWIIALARGIRERSTDFRFETFGVQPVPVPPSGEQKDIVRFLDWASRRFERAVRVKRRVIALLNEQKQVVVHRAVTSGPGSSVPLKPSNVPWLHEIPHHWETRPLKQLLIRMDYGTSENSRGEGRVRVLTMGHIRDGKIVLPQTGSLSTVPPGLLLEKNDLLFNRTNSPELVGKVGVFVGSASDEITFASYLVRLRVRPEVNPFWLNYLLNSAQFWGYARSQALISLHQANLNSTRYGQMVVPLPPSRTEQDQIVEHVDSQTHELEEAIAHLKDELALLWEFRTRLIADVVTGKLDVRGITLQADETGEDIDSPIEAEVETDEDGLVEENADADN